MIVQEQAYCIVLAVQLASEELYVLQSRVNLVEGVCIVNSFQVLADNGKVVGMGVHEELLENCEVYKSIVASQLSDSEEEGAE